MRLRAFGLYVKILSFVSGVILSGTQVLYAQFAASGTTVLENQTLSFTDALTTAVLSDGEIRFRHCTFRSDSAMSDPAYEGLWREKLMNIAAKDGKILVKSRVIFDSCRLPSTKFSSMYFEQGLSFTGCVIDEYLGFKKCYITSLGVSKTTVTTGVEVEGLINFELDRCIVGICAFASNDMNTVSYDQTRFLQYAQVFAPFSRPLNSFTFTGSVLDSGATLELAGHIRVCSVAADTTDGVMNIGATILNMLTITDCHFKRAVVYNAFNTPERATTMRWDQFSGYKLTVADTVNGGNVTERSDYESLLKTYSFFYNIYAKNWQDESKNDCYVEMKQVQTRWLGISYYRNPSFTNWLVWQLNVFLEVFCKYGTEPVMAIQYSLWILLAFAALYFILPGQVDGSRLRFTHTFYNLASHREERIRQVTEVENNIRALKLSHDAAPRFARLVGIPFYYGHIFQYRCRLWLVRQSVYVEKLQERKESGGTSGRTGVVILAGLYFCGLLTLTVGIRAVNASALSLNAFVTLGYGEIQAKGISRYFAVLEGALGWFLLSIFSVSLISQILQ